MSLSRLLCRILLAALAIRGASDAWAAEPASSERVIEKNHVVILNSYGYGNVGVEIFNQAMTSTLSKAGLPINNVSIEYLDIQRNDEPYRQRSATFLREKYDSKKIDLVITIQGPALDFLQQLGPERWRAVPLITVAAPPPDTISGRPMASFVPKLDIPGTLDLAIKLFPKTSLIMVVSGSTPSDRRLADDAQAVQAPWRERVHMEFLTGQTVEEVVAHTSALPPHSVILFTQYNADSNGLVTNSLEVMNKITERANAPLFALFDTDQFGKGVGGSVIPIKTAGRNVGNMAADLLSGKLTLPEGRNVFEIMPIQIINWEAAVQFHGEIGNLPPQTVFINRPPKLWEQYKAEVSSTVLAVLILSLLIIALMMQNRRRKLAEVSARVSEMRFRQLVEQAPEAILVFDSDAGIVADANAKAEDLWGLGRTELIGRPLAELYPLDVEQPDHRPVAESSRSVIQQALAGQTCVFERIVRGTVGADRICEVRVTRLPAITGHFLRASYIDVTERKHGERELRQYQHHLEELVLDRTKSLEAEKRNAEMLASMAESANRAKSIFLANMSHELRTPLTSVIGFSQLLAEDRGISADQRSKLGHINRSGNHLLTLINNVLDLSKIEAGRIQLTIQEIDPRELIGDVAEIMRLRAEQKGLSLVVRTAALPLGILCDPVKLRQVLLNLLSNAIKFTTHGSITLEVTGSPVEANQIRLDFTVTDSGIGIAAQDQERIFEPFTQTGTANEQAGTGLGLTISRDFVRMLGGDLTVVSKPGRGSAFHFFLIADPCEPPSVEPNCPHRRPVGIEAGGAALRVLVAEDTSDIRALLRNLLAPLGIEVIEAGDGAAATASAANSPPDLVFMDWRMPIIDGIEATRRIRAHPGGKQPKIVMLTASAFTEDRRTAIAAGADDFLGKPFRPAEIYDALERHLDIRFRYEAISIDTVNFRESSPPPTAREIATLPESHRLALAEAVQEMNKVKISAAIEQISLEHPELAPRLKAMIDSAKFLELHNLMGAISTSP